LAQQLQEDVGYSQLQKSLCVLGRGRMLGMHGFAWWPTLIVLAVATFTDLRSRRIPNWLVFPFLLAGIVVSPLRHDWQGSSHGFGWHGLGQSLAGLGLSLLINIIPFFMGWTGGGDVKLCAAIGAWVGPEQLFWSIFFTALAGGIMVLGWAAYGGFRKLFSGAGDLIFGGKQSEMRCEPAMALASPARHKMPYAPAIAIGTVVSFFVR
jgi:prepilin peptidase CpaA